MKKAVEYLYIKIGEFKDQGCKLFMRESNIVIFSNNVAMRKILDLKPTKMHTF